MFPSSLSPEKNASAKDVYELRSLLETGFATSYRPAALSDITLQENGTIQVHGEVIPFTQKFLEDVSGYIKMPPAYAYDIDYPLFARNFEARKFTKNKAVQICLVADRAVGLADGDYCPARTADVLVAIEAAEIACWRVESSSVSDRGVDIDMLSDNLVVEPMPGDEIRTGIRISNSETGGRLLKASVYCLRLVCSNGAVMADQVGTVRWASDSRVTYDSSIANFASHLIDLRDSHRLLQMLYSASVGRPALEEDVARLWRRIRSVGRYSPEFTDFILGITREQRRRLVAAVAARREENQPAVASEWDLFTLHNSVTAGARSLSGATRSRLERIGGEILSL